MLKIKTTREYAPIGATHEYRIHIKNVIYKMQ